MARERPYIGDILAAVREGRIGAATAAEWLDLRAAEHAREVRQVRARAVQQRGRLAPVPGAGEMSDEEADGLLPPRTAEEFCSPRSRSRCSRTRCHSRAATAPGTSPGAGAKPATRTGP